MNLFAEDYWIMATAGTCGAGCALVGSYLLLRRMSLLGDALSHALLPGLAVAFFLGGTRNIGIMSAGALISSLLTVVSIDLLSRVGRMSGEAATGVAFTAFFALGVLLITWVARDVDLDPGCVLYGQLEFVAFDTISIAGCLVPRAMVWMTMVLALNIAALSIFFKEIVLVAFDSAFATALGFSAWLIHYALLSLATITMVTSFQAVGSILVIALLIAPPATAYLYTDRVGRLMFLAVVFAVSASVLGYLLALYWNTSAAALIAVVAGAQFLLSVFVAPSYGVLAKSIRQFRITLRIVREDILGALYRSTEAERHASDVTCGAAASLVTRIAAFQLRRAGLIQGTDAVLSLTSKGEDVGRAIVRTHRLWESYLDKHLTLPLDHLHEPSDTAEHFTSGELRSDLAKEVACTIDPHGKKIPPDTL